MVTQQEVKNFTNFISSKAVSKMGDIMFDFANNTFLAGVSPNSFYLIGVYQILENIVSIVFNLVGGVIADKFKKNKIIISFNLFSGFLCILLSFISIEKWLIFAILTTNALLAFMSSFTSPCYKAFTKEIVRKDNISRLNSYLELVSTIIKVIVPIFSVFFYNILGIHGVLFLNGISFLISGLLIFYITPISSSTNLSTQKKLSVKKILYDILMGFNYLKKHKIMLLIIVLSALVNFFLAAYNLLLPYSSQMFPNLPNGLYGVFLAAEAIGGLIGAVISRFLNKHLSPNRLVLFLGLSGISISILPILYIIFSNQFIIATSPLLFSMFLTVFNIQFFSLVQRDVDLNYLGRIFGIIYTVALLFMPIGTTLFTSILDPKFMFNFSLIGLSVLILSLFFGVLFNTKCKHV